MAPVVDQLRAGLRQVFVGAATRVVELAEKAPASRPVKVPLESVAEPTPRSSTRPVGTSGVAPGLTPARISAILREADDGDPTRFSELMREIEDRDLHLVGVLSTRKRAVAHLPWEVEPASDKRQDRRVAELVTRRLQEIDNLEDGFLDLLDAISQGVAFVELDWVQVADGYGIRSLQYRPQSWFIPDRDRVGQWRVRDQADIIQGIELTPRRFAVHVSKAKSGFPVQAALGRVLTWWWLFKSYALKDWVTYAELFGAPLRVGRFPAGTSPTDRDALHLALRQLGVDAVATIPEDMKIEFVEMKGATGDVHQRLADFVNREMSKGILGQTLTTEEGKSGSRALGQVHDQVRQDILVADAKQLASTIRRDLVAPLVLFHFGAGVALPRFRFDTEPEADQKAAADTQKVRAEVFAMARSLGIPVSIAQVQDELQIREVAAGEAVLPLPTKQPEPGPGEAAAASQTPRSPHLVPMACPGCGGHHPVLALADGVLPPTLQQLDLAAGRYLTEGGQQAWADLVAQMRQSLLAGQPDVGDLGARFEEIVRSLGPDHAGLMAVADELANATLTADLVGQLQVRNDEQVIEGLPQIPPTEAADWWMTKTLMPKEEFDALAAAHRARAFSISGYSTLTALGDAHKALQRVIREGKTLSDFEDAIEASSTATRLGPAHLQNVFRTNWGTAYAVGRDHEQRRPATLSRRPYWRYNALDDSRVRREHALQNGTILPFDHPFWTIWSPPNGYQCRCWRTAHSMEEILAMGWSVSDAAVLDPLTGKPSLPDPGFRTDPSRDPDQLNWMDWSQLPREWIPLIHAEIRGDA